MSLSPIWYTLAKGERPELLAILLSTYFSPLQWGLAYNWISVNIC